MLEELEDTILYEGLNQLGYIFRRIHSEPKAYEFVKYFPEEKSIYLVYDTEYNKYVPSDFLGIPEKKLLFRKKTWEERLFGKED